MNELSIARRYAKAIFELGLEEGRFDEIGSELLAAGQALEADKDLLAALEDPATSREARLKLAEALAGGLRLSPTVANALKLLAERNRLAIAPQVAQAYSRLADEQAGRLHARLVSAIPLNEEAASRIGSELARATGRKVVVERAVDPSILGGIVAHVGGTTFDGSLRTQLEGLKRQLKA